MRPETFDGQFATRAKAGELNGYFALLPDPDPILRKKGIDVSTLRALLVDTHLSAVASVRAAAVSSAPWRLKAGREDDANAARALEFVYDNFVKLDIPRIIEEAVEHVYYGYKPMELDWDIGTVWRIRDIVGKPTEWFGFDQNNALIFKGKSTTAQERAPADRIVCLSHMASYVNPYGEKTFAKCFWPVTFKRAGWQWWTTFIEKYGGLIALGKYPKADEKERGKILDFLAEMIADAVGAVPEGTVVEFKESASKESSSNTYKTYLTAANDEISKAVLGQTLTTQLGSTGSYAAAKIHDMVRKDLAIADKRRVAQFFNTVACWLTAYNFPPGTSAPFFVFDEDEDLKKAKVERDKLLYDMGVRFTKGHIASEYGIPEDGFELVTLQPSGLALPQSRLCRMHGEATTLKRTLFTAQLKRSLKEEKRLIKDITIAEKFSKTQQNKLKKGLDSIIKTLLYKIDAAQDYGEIIDILCAAYPNLNFDEIVRALENVMYVADQLGASGQGR